MYSIIDLKATFLLFAIFKKNVLRILLKIFL